MTKTLFEPVIFLVLLFNASSLQAEDPVNDRETYPRPKAAKAEEAKIAKFSIERAGTFLDNASMTWLREQKCASCHTNYPHLLAKTALDANAPAARIMRRYLEERVMGWDEGGKNKGLPEEEDEAITEVVATAATLALNDVQVENKLNDRTKRALDRIWTIQRKDGAWGWNQHGLPPQELDEYYGAVYAAIGVGHAPGGYGRSEAAKEGVAKLRAYLNKHEAPNLHHRLMLVWAAQKIEGLMSAEEQAKAIQEVIALQRKDGGWNLPSLVKWRRHDGTANDETLSDGYATGFMLYILKQTNAKRTDAIDRGLAWLTSNQRESGRWFTRSISADRAHYIANAGSAYAILAIKAWESLPAYAPTHTRCRELLLCALRLMRNAF
ncbi:MAG: prenyltransferase/squalene oxidase repeat-containing protein [Gemmataceae bacterium]